MASQFFDNCTDGLNYEDATIIASGSATGENVLVTFDNTAESAAVDAAITRAIAIVTHYFANLP